MKVDSLFAAEISVKFKLLRHNIVNLFRLSLARSRTIVPFSSRSSLLPAATPSSLSPPAALSCPQPHHRPFLLPQLSLARSRTIVPFSSRSSLLSAAAPSSLSPLAASSSGCFSNSLAYQRLRLSLQLNHGPNRATILNTIHEACKNDGFFLIKNHGIPDDVVDGMMEVSRDFFRLPESERLKTYSEDTTRTVRLSCSFNVNKEEVGSWRDYLRLHCYPLEDYVRDWPSQPPSFRSHPPSLPQGMGSRNLKAFSQEQIQSKESNDASRKQLHLQ
ncbi:DMR6-LIKE OXYGENASE 2 protein [Nymphaea thermarum]|nr:DMR6-LIKE OXYGENASE 2 protein [Nymphaea thermarum]